MDRYSIFPEKGEEDNGEYDDHDIQSDEEDEHIIEALLDDGSEGDIGDLTEEEELGDDEGETEDGHEGCALLGAGGDSCQEGEYEAEADAAEAADADEGGYIRHGVTQHESEEEEAEGAHQQHEQGIEQEFGEDEVAGSCDGIEIQQAAAAFLQETFSYCIYADEELDHPEQSFPDIAIGLSHGEIEYEDGGSDIQ